MLSSRRWCSGREWAYRVYHGSGGTTQDAPKTFAAYGIEYSYLVNMWLTQNTQATYRLSIKTYLSLMVLFMMMIPTIAARAFLPVGRRRAALGKYSQEDRLAFGIGVCACVNVNTCCTIVCTYHMAHHVIVSPYPRLLAISKTYPFSTRLPSVAEVRSHKLGTKAPASCGVYVDGI